MSRKILSIRWKFLFMGISLVVVPTVIIGALVYNTYRKEAFENTRHNLKLIATGWYTAADVYYEEIRRVLKREEYLFEKRLSSIVLDVGKMVNLHERICRIQGEDAAHDKELFDQIRQVAIGRSGYVFIFDKEGRYVLSPDRKSDGASIFERQDPAFVDVYRQFIDQTVQMKEGEVRVVHYDWKAEGEEIPRPKVAAILFLPRYGWFIGATAYYTDFKSYELERIIRDELRDRMAAQKIGDHGYIWALSGAGNFIVSKDRLRDGEKVIASRGYGGQGVAMVDIIQEALSADPGQPFIKKYVWRDLGEERPSRMLAAIVYHPGWDWIIGASACERDFFKGLLAIRWQIVQVCLLFIVLGSLTAYFFASLISRPIMALEKTAVKGDLNAPVDKEALASNDEVGSLAHAFQTMMRHLREKIEEIERSKADLLAINEQLTHTQGQLFRSEKLAAIGRLAAGVAHEINNPLAYVMSNLETLEQYVKTYEEVLRELETAYAARDIWKDRVEAVRAISGVMRKAENLRLEGIRHDIKDLMAELYDGLVRVKKIVFDLKTFARAEKEQKTEADLEEILERMIIIVTKALTHSVNVVREYGRIPRILCHEERIGQVFMNVVMNAAQAVPADEGIIRVKTYADQENVYIDIADNGPGIAPEDLPRIFEPFFTTKSVGHGMGLGLSISYEIIKKHNGDIKVASQFGQGTTFTIILPIGEDGRKGERTAVR